MSGVKVLVLAVLVALAAALQGATAQYRPRMEPEAFNAGEARTQPQASAQYYTRDNDDIDQMLRPHYPTLSCPQCPACNLQCPSQDVTCNPVCGDCNCGDCNVDCGQDCIVDFAECFGEGPNPTCCSGLCVQAITLPIDYCVPGPPRESGPDPLTMGALSGATLINTLESSTPVALRDLKTGQHVPCLGSLQDLTLSATPRWCEVTNYLVAAPKVDQTGSMMMVKLTAPDGREETLMTTARQYFTVLADLDHNVAGNKSPPSIETAGVYTEVPAHGLVRGDRVLMKPTDMAPEFVLGTVKSARLLKGKGSQAAEGFYKPAIDAPYLLVGGVVVPMFNMLNVHDAQGRVPQELVQAAIKAQHQLLAPLYTQVLQPAGTPAHDATWGQKQVWDKWADIAAHIESIVKSEDAAKTQEGLAAINTWFAPLYKAYTDTKTAVPVQDVEEFLRKSSQPQGDATKPQDPPVPQEPVA